jgi:glycerol-3-phosphate O-acyltransferase
MTTGQSRLQWFGWLRSFLEGWVRAKLVPGERVLDQLGIDPTRPICYVLKSNSIFDFLVLDIFCAKNNLPRPLAGFDDLGDNKDASSVYLSHVGILRTYGAYRNEPPSPFFKLLRRVGQQESFDVQLVPVSVFWGRDPGRGEPSVFKLFFPDDDRASFIQKLFIVLAHGKNIVINYSKPIHLREQISNTQSVEQTARKLTRVIRVHFQTLRNSVLGPGLISRTRVIETLVRGKALKVAIDDECRKKNIPRDRAERLAKEYISEIAAEVSPEIIAGLSILLKRLWNKIYSGVAVEHIERLRSIPANAEIVYVPCHRSHMDYLLLNYVLYDNHFLTPHVAAGINLNFWPVGSLIRRVGAFYIRRSFNNNRLYAVAFSEYVSFLLQRGFPVQFFLEGGRSRTGKVLPPKTGMVSMVVSSFLRNHDRPIFFVPVYIAYDRVAEVKTYRKELSGSKKKSESVGQLVQGRKALRSSHGQAYISFAEPINLGEFIDSLRPGWRDVVYDSDAKPNWMNPVIQSLSLKVMTSINEAAVCGSVALVSMILLATRQRALPEDELLAHIDMLKRIAKASPYSIDVRLPDLPASSILEIAERVGKLSRFTHPGGDVIHAVEPQASLLTYYRNNVAHLFAVPSVVAFFLQHNDSISEDLIRQGMSVIYPVIKKEFFLRWDSSEIEGVTNQYIKVLRELGLFAKSDNGAITRPDMTSFEFNILRTIGLIVGPALERFALATHLLKQYGDGVEFKMEDFQKRCLMMAQRLSLLTGATDAELPSAQVFAAIFDQLTENGMIETASVNTWKLTAAFSNIFGLTSALLSVDMRHSMARAKG